MHPQQIIKLNEQPELFWNMLKSLKLSCNEVHFLFSKKQYEYRKQRLIDENLLCEDISFLLLESESLSMRSLGLNKQTNRTITTGELPSSSLEHPLTRRKKVIAER